MSSARGTMRQRSPGSWQLRVYVGLDAAGKLVHLAKTYRGTKRAPRDQEGSEGPKGRPSSSWRGSLSRSSPDMVTAESARMRSVPHR